MFHHSSLQITIKLTEGALLIFWKSKVKKFQAWADNFRS